MKRNGYKFYCIVILFSCLLFSGGCSSIRHLVKRDKDKNTEQIQKDREIEKEAEKVLKGDEKKIIEEAFRWEGTPYVFGRQDRGVATDCSGMVMRVFEEAIGCKLPRNSARQAEFCQNITSAHVRPGDLVFFITNGGGKINHVGIMIDKTNFIHASTKGVMVSSLESNYYKTHFQKFGRVPCMKH